MIEALSRVPHRTHVRTRPSAAVTRPIRGPYAPPAMPVRHARPSSAGAAADARDLGAAGADRPVFPSRPRAPPAGRPRGGADRRPRRPGARRATSTCRSTCSAASTGARSGCSPRTPPTSRSPSPCRSPGAPSPTRPSSSASTGGASRSRSTWSTRPWPAWPASDHWLTDFLQTCTEAERAELRSTASDRVAKFFECFPPLEARWRPVTESSQIVDLAGRPGAPPGQGRPHAGHRPRASQAGKVIVDLKTGAPNPVHRDDLRFYALLDTIRLGVPPRLVASFYLDLAEARTEPVTEGVLDATVARTVDAARRLAALRAGTTEPVYRPSYGCRWCVALADVLAPGQRWLADDDRPRRRRLDA